MGWVLRFLPFLSSVSVSAWLWVFLSLIVGTNAITAIKVAGYVRTGYENINLKNEVVLIERERKVAVLDGKTLEKALKEQRERLENEQKAKEVINGLIEEHEATGQPWCSLNDNELRVWNNENLGKHLEPNPAAGTRRGMELPLATDGKLGGFSQPVAK